MPQFSCHFQTFETEASSAHSADRVAKLRDVLAAQGLHGFIVPRSDAHLNEYVPASEERLLWLTGFNGSAGTAIILEREAALFVDGRYTVQAQQQIDHTVFASKDITALSPTAWLASTLQAGQKLGFDPWLHTPNEIEKLKKTCAAAQAELIAVDRNPIDTLWQGRPAKPITPVLLHPVQFTGEEARAKITRVQKAVTKAHADTLVLSDAHAIAWLFNIRGKDVAHTPLPLAFALIHADEKPALFIDPAKLDDVVREALSADILIETQEAFTTALAELGEKTVWLDPASNTFKVQDILEKSGATLHKAEDPTVLMKAVKNTVEMKGARTAHLRDGVALCQFLAWLDEAVTKKPVNEIEVAEALETFRRSTGLLKDVSFPTISAANEHAALPHYRVTRTTNRLLEKGFYLVDSGAQYEDGTTDVTRTVVIGEATAEMRDRFTRVLQGHIAVANAVFPKGTTGAQLDSFARRPLWDIGTDFDHGTGHGVGSYLSVHEGPQRISRLGNTRLQAGMVLSNEPAYYREGHYGIRLENLVLVQELAIPQAERTMLGFENLTLAPFDRRGIMVESLTIRERRWLDHYHKRVQTAIAPYVDEKTNQWLAQACAPL